MRCPWEIPRGILTWIFGREGRKTVEKKGADVLYLPFRCQDKRGTLYERNGMP